MQFFLLLLWIGIFSSILSFGARATTDESRISNWIIKLQGNQGIFLLPSDSPGFVDGFIKFKIKYRILRSFPFDYEVLSLNWTKLSNSRHSAKNSTQNFGRWKWQNYSNASKYSCLSHDKSLPEYFVTDMAERLLPPVTAALFEQRLELSFPFNDSYYYFGGPVIDCKCGYLNSNPNPMGTLTLSVPVRKMWTSKLELVQIFFMEYITQSGLCLSTLSQRPPVGMNEPIFALVLNQTVYPLPHLSSKYPNISNCVKYSYCCQISEEFWKKHSKPDHCLSAIYGNHQLELIHKYCKFHCRHDQGSRGDSDRPQQQFLLHFLEKYPSIIQLEDTLYVSRVYSSLNLVCGNETRSASIPPPPMGALIMKMYCRCKLYYGGVMLWFRAHSRPSQCSEENGALLVYQLMPSGRVHPFLLESMTVSKMESTVFLNISGVLISADEFVEKYISARQTRKGVSWTTLVLIAVIGVTTQIAYLLHWRRRRHPLPASVPILPVASITRRRG